MNKVRYILMLCLLSCSAAYAQTFEDVSRRSFWQESGNVAGIREDSLSRSFAEVYGGYEWGGFRDTWQAVREWRAGASTGSVLHMDRMSLTGSFSFVQNEGYGMCGSMFIDPGYFPVDVLEFTPGRKTRQTYSFDGGIAYDVDKRWSIGARMDFEAANLAKRKDLRHANWRLDMTVAPGVMYRNGDFAVGLSPMFRKVSETVEAEQIGTAESSYYAFLDKGLMYGVHQVWTGSGVHLADGGVNGFPVREYSYGGSLQFRYKGLYLDFEHLWMSGSIGEKEYIWFGFNGTGISANLRYRWTWNSVEHHARVRFARRIQNLDENVLERISENGVTTVLNHGSNRIFSRGMFSLSPEYEFVSRRVEVRASANVLSQDGLSFQMYPFVASRNMITFSADADLLVRLGRFDLGVHAGFGGGNVSEEERMVEDNLSVQTSPYRLQEWYDRQMAYMTADRLDAGISLRYRFAKGIYVGISGDWLRGFGFVSSDGADRFGSALKVGYDF